jgi:hypothetical protein
MINVSDSIFEFMAGHVVKPLENVEDHCVEGGAGSIVPELWWPISDMARTINLGDYRVPIHDSEINSIVPQLKTSVSNAKHRR